VVDVTQSVITVSALSRRFGTKDSSGSVSLSLARGAVYGLVGETGAGKTTLIKHCLGLLRAESGSVRVFGLIRSPIPSGSYSPHRLSIRGKRSSGWMRVEELFAISVRYPGWNDVTPQEIARGVCEHRSTAKIKTLSKGRRRGPGLLIGWQPPEFTRAG